MLDTEVKATKESSHSVTFPAKAFAARSATSGLGPFTLQRRTPRAQDVQIEILYCGVCHSDLHQVRDEWNAVMPTVYPCVPGHEMVGRVVKVGSAVKKFKEGDIAAVGCNGYAYVAYTAIHFTDYSQGPGYPDRTYSLVKRGEMLD